jgi:hypothetical protein
MVEVECPAVSPGTDRPGRGAVIFGLVLSAMGAFIGMLATGLIPADLTVPREVVLAPAAGMVAFGLYMLGRGALGMVERRRLDRLRARHPGEPWRGDHPWTPEGTHQGSYGDVGGPLVIAGFCFLFLVPFNWWAFLSPDRSWPLILAVGLFDLLLVVAPLAFAVYQLGHALRYGGAFVRFDRFPFFLGETLSVHLGSDRPVGKYSRLVVTLRCVEVRTVVSRSGNAEVHKQVCYEHHAATRELPPGELTPGTEIEATFELPRGDYATQLGGQEPRYWTVEVKAATTGVDFKADFLVPVYAKPRGA